MRSARTLNKGVDILEDPPGECEAQDRLEDPLLHRRV